MDLKDYQERSRVTAKYPDLDNNFTYPTLGLVGEAGEVADKVKKLMRDEGIFSPAGLSDEQKHELSKELGDVLWYLAQLATELDIGLDEIAEKNIEKLSSRMERGKLHGSGDNR